MPLLGFGTYKLKEAAGAEAIRAAIELGYRHLDTAANYENEETVGEGIRRSGIDRKSLWITTKVDRLDLAKDAFVGSCRRSLDRIGVDYVDLLLVHWPNEEVPIEETLEAARSLIDEGVVKHFGVSNFIRPTLKEAVDKGIVPVEVNQVEYHPQLPQRGLLRMCKENEVLLTAYSPLAQGALVRDPVMLDVARKLGRTVAQVCLRWLMQQGMAAIPKTATPARMAENLEAVNFELSPQDMALIDGITERRRAIEWWPGRFERDPDVFE